MEYNIRPAMPFEWEEAMSLAWRVFKKYEAPEYSQEGVNNFLNFISDEDLYRMFMAGDYKLYLAVSEHGPSIPGMPEASRKIVGIIGIRMVSHVSLLFVDEHYHKLGIGRALVEYAAQAMRKENRAFATVHAAPYAVDFYHRIGFEDIAEETVSDGITYTPMRYKL